MGSRPECGPGGLVDLLRHSDEGLKQRQQELTAALEELDQSQGARRSARPMKMAARPHTASELPLEELLALYGYQVPDPLLQPERDRCQLAASLPDMTLDKNQITKDLFPGEEEEEEGSSADDLTPFVTSNTSDLLRRLQGGDKDTTVVSSEEDSDGSIPSNEERKDIMVGSMYQAKIPPLSPYTYQERVYDGEDQLLWRPGVLSVQEMEVFLLSAQMPGVQDGAAHPHIAGDTVRDNEQALYELVKCNFNVEEALRRLRFNVKVFSEELCGWTEEECRNFETGYRAYGKNFHLIQVNKVRTRSVGECVQYYYMWKKSERHEYFTQQATKLSRKKYNLQAGNMEDADQDGEVGDSESCSNSKSSSHVSLETPSPLPLPGLDLDKPGGGPSQTQKNTSLSVKAMTLVHQGYPKQAGPAGGDLGMGVELYIAGHPQQLFSHPTLEKISQEQGPVPNPGSGPCCLPLHPHPSSQSRPRPPPEDPNRCSGFYQNSRSVGFRWMLACSLPPRPLSSGAVSCARLPSGTPSPQ